MDVCGHTSLTTHAPTSDVQDKVKVEKLVWGTDTRDELPRFDVVIASDTLCASITAQRQASMVSFSR